jgi:hypothetical protein
MFTLKESEKEGKYEIYLDGEFCKFAYAYGRKHEKEIYEIISRDKFNSKKIAQYSLSEIPAFDSISLYDLFDWLNFNHYVTLSENLEKNNSDNWIKTGKFEIGFSLYPNLSDWNERFTFMEYHRTFNQIWNGKKISNAGFAVYKDESPSIEITFIRRPIKDIPLNEFIAASEKIVKDVQEETLKTLSSRFDSYAINEIFEFPEQVSVFCKQYLDYFAQFLKDLGIKASSNLKEEAGKVLFSVTPTDDIDALDKIREALAVYLNLPSSPIVYDDSFAAMRLQQQIENLQHSQRMAVREFQLSEKVMQLQSETIREKDILLSQKDSIIDQKDKIIEKISSKSIMTDSLENKEKLYEGLEFMPSEALKKYLGIIFQPVTFFKTLGENLVGKENENLSILQSSEETEKND